MHAEEPLDIVHLVCSGAFAGVERYVAYTAPALQELGHRVTVVGGDPPSMRRVLAGSGVKFLAADSPMKAVRTLVAPEVRGSRPDLVHAHMTEAEVVAVATRPFHRAPVVATLHFAHPRGRTPVRQAIWSPLPRFLAGQFAISQAVATASGQWCTVVPSGVPVPTPVPSQRRRPVVLAAQRFEPEKDTRSAIEIWARSGLADLGWELHLAGAGSQERELAELATSSRVADSVRFVGFVDDLPLRMRSASVLLATTPNDGLGLSVIEAMSAALPVVAARGGGYVEVISPVDGRYLFDPGDTVAGARMLRSLALDPVDAATFGSRLRDRYLAEYTVERHAARLVTAYRQVLASRRAAAGTASGTVGRR